MEQALQVFKYKETEIRTVIVAGEIWFVAANACKVLEHSDTGKAVSRLDEDEKGTNTVRTPGGPQEMLCVNEPGFYSLVLTSRKPEAKPFKRWVTHEVIPSIRKTGSYSLHTEAQPVIQRVYPWTEEAEQLRQINMKTIQPGFFTSSAFVLQKLIYVDLGKMTPDERAKIDISFGQFFSRWLKGDRKGQLKGCTVRPEHPYDPSLIQKIGQVVDSETRRKYPVYHYANAYAGDRDTFWDMWYAPVILPVYLKGKLPDGLPRMMIQDRERLSEAPCAQLPQTFLEASASTSVPKRISTKMAKVQILKAGSLVEQLQLFPVA